MKQKDIAIVLLFAVIGGVISYFTADKIFVSDSISEQKSPVVMPVMFEFKIPDERFFNVDSLNPARDASLDATNQTPFNGAQ